MIWYGNKSEASSRIALKYLGTQGTQRKYMVWKIEYIAGMERKYIAGNSKHRQYENIGEIYRAACKIYGMLYVQAGKYCAGQKENI